MEDNTNRIRCQNKKMSLFCDTWFALNILLAFTRRPVFANKFLGSTKYGMQYCQQCCSVNKIWSDRWMAEVHVSSLKKSPQYVPFWAESHISLQWIDTYNCYRGIQSISHALHTVSLFLILCYHEISTINQCIKVSPKH